MSRPLGVINDCTKLFFGVSVQRLTASVSKPWAVVMFLVGGSNFQKLNLKYKILIVVCP